MRAAPAVSCAIAHKERAHEHTGSAGASRPSLRSGFTAYSVLSPVNGSFACQSALKFDPVSASNFDPFERRVLAVALAPSELVGVAETARARVVGA